MTEPVLYQFLQIRVQWTHQTQLELNQPIQVSAMVWYAINPPIPQIHLMDKTDQISIHPTDKTNQISGHTASHAS